MSSSRQSFPLVTKEWRRLLGRLKRHGALRACDHVSHLIQDGTCPIIFSIKLVEYLLRRREYKAAGRIIEAVERSGTKDPLMDDLRSSWLWCIGKRRAALSFALRSAKYWRKSYVVHKVGTLYRLMYQRTGSDYHRKKSLHYWRLAHVLVRQEEEAKQRQTDRATRRGNKKMEKA